MPVQPSTNGEREVASDENSSYDPEHQPREQPAPRRRPASLRAWPRGHWRQPRRCAAVQLPLDDAQEPAIWPKIAVADTGLG
eukprot:6576897-Pyramimonas_sp.AAC.1